MGEEHPPTVEGAILHALDVGPTLVPIGTVREAVEGK